MILVTKAYLPSKEKLQHYIDQIYSTGQLTNYGPLVQELEIRLSNYLGVRNLILVANGTLALQVAYKALGIKGSAITTPFSFPATTSSLVWEGIEPIFADISHMTWNLNPKEIEKAIRSDTTAIVPVHVFGNACEVEAIQEIADRHNLKVIYDGAHTFGVKYKGESLLNWGDISTLSFHATKIFHTLEGGALITNNDTLAKKIRLLINFGIVAPEKVLGLGVNAKMNEFEAAMGLCVLDDIEHIHEERKRVWNTYQNTLTGALILQERNSAATQNYSHFPILFENEEILRKVEKALKEYSIFSRRYFSPSLDTLAYLGIQKNMLIARNVASRILCLPIYAELSDIDVKKICYIINDNLHKGSLD